MHQQQEPTQIPIVSQTLTRVWLLLRDYDFEFSELITGLVSFFWGLSLLNPAWNSFDTTPIYRLMAQVAPEEAWGTVLLSLGTLQLVALLAEWWSVRRVVAMWGCGLWAFVSYIVITTNPRAPIAVTAPAFLFASAWAYLRMRFHRRRGD